MFVGPIKSFERQRWIKQQKIFYYSINSFKKHGQVLQNSYIKNFCKSFRKYKILTFLTVADGDIMGRIITQTRGQAFCQAFGFSLKLQKIRKQVIEKLGRVF